MTEVEKLSEKPQTDLKAEVEHCDFARNADVDHPSEVVPAATTHNSLLETLLALFALAMTFGSQLGVGSNMAPSALHEIAVAFGADAIALQSWTSAGWLLSTSVAFTVAGRLSDVFGRFAIIAGSNVLALVGFTMCAFSDNFSVYIGGIVILGFAGGMASTATAAACEIVPNKYRPAAISFLELSIAPTGYLTGSTMSHYILSYTTYKWIFRLGMILCGIAFAACLAFYRPPSRPMHDGRRRRDHLREIDFFGFGLFASGLGVFLMGVVWAGGQYAANDPHVIAPIIAGLVLLVLFVLWEIRTGDNAIIPPRLFKGKWRSYGLPVLVHFVAGTVFFSQIAIWPQQTVLFYAKDLIEVGILGLPPGAAVFVGGCIVAVMIPKMGPTNRQLLAAIAFMAAATACMAALTPTSKIGAIACVMLANLPFHMIVNLCFLTVQFTSAKEDIGVAVGVCGTGRSVGGSIGVAIYTTILNSRIPKEVPAYIAAAGASVGLAPEVIAQSIAGLLGHDAETVSSLPGVTPDILSQLVTAMNLGYQACFKTVYLSTLAFGVIGVIAAAFTVDVSHFFNDVVAVELEHKKPHSSVDAV